MRLLDLIEQHNCIWSSPHCLSELATLVVPNIPCNEKECTDLVRQSDAEDTSQANLLTQRMQNSLQSNPDNDEEQFRKGISPGGEPMSFETVWRSMNSDISKRTMASSLPK